MDENKKITENKPDVPYIVYEGEMTRAERYIKRLWIALVVAILSLGVAVIAFMWYLSLYDFSTYDYEQTGEGVNIVGDENGVDYNGSESDHHLSAYMERIKSKRQVRDGLAFFLFMR